MEEIKIKAPTLDPVESLYVKAYLSSLSHLEAHRVAAPSLKHHHHENSFSKRENILFYISKGLQNKAESLSLTPEVVLERLFHEATSYGQGSHATARIAALQLLGKHLGMFQEKQLDRAPVFNIISYSSDKLPPSLESLPSSTIQENQESVSKELFSLTTYSSSEESCFERSEENPSPELEGDLDG